jgi:dGTP triphosphohydrolase
MTIEELEAKLEVATKHRDAWKKMLDETNRHILDMAALVEPGLNRHPITVIQAAQESIRTLVEQRDKAFQEAIMDAAIIDAARAERNEARAEVERLREESATQADISSSTIARMKQQQREARAEAATAYRRGAEAMREAAARELDRLLTKKKATAIWVGPDDIRALSIPEEP